MAILYDGIECSICGNVIVDLKKVVATTHFISDEHDELWRFSDSAMHAECFANWKHREAFVNRYNQTMGAIVWGSGSRHEKQPDGRIEIICPDTSD